MIVKIVIVNVICNIKIYDLDNNIVFNNICNGYVYFDGKINNVYKIIITSVYGSIISSFIVKDDINIMIFYFNSNHKIVTFKLFDSYYKNLLIEKGVIKLCLNLT